MVNSIGCYILKLFDQAVHGGPFALPSVIKQALKAKGTPIPINDVWLAAQCMETRAVLVTYDHHFDVVDGLRLWSPPSHPLR